MLVQDVIHPSLVLVCADDRTPNGESRGPADTIYAVFGGSQADGPGSLIGLVTCGSISEHPDRLFADLVPDGAPPIVATDTPVDELLSQFEDESWPRAVVDEQGSLIGVITRGSMLTALLAEQTKLLHTAHSAERLAKGVDHSSSRLSAATELMRLWTSQLSEREIIQRAIEALCSLLDSRFGAVAMLDDKGQLSDFSFTGVTPGTLEAIGRYPEGRGLLGKVIHMNDAIRVADISQHPDSSGFPPDHPEMKALLAVPVAGEDGVIGRVYICDKESGEEFTEEDERIARSFAASLYGVWVYRRADEERDRLHVQLAEARKLEAIGQLAAGIAHEINTPMQFVGDNTRFLQNSVSDLLEVIGEYGQLSDAVRQNRDTIDALERVDLAVARADLEYLRDEIPKSLEQSLEGIGRVTQIVGAMKEFSHPGTKERSPIDLNRALEATVIVSRNEWKYVAEMETDFGELPPVSCLPGQLNQVMLNLIVNASHAIGDVVGDGTQGKGTIRIRTRQDGDWVEVRISDTGSGIPVEVRPRVFEPFFTTKEVGKGTGQGLAIAYSTIVDQHRGTITFETLPGRGTTFVVRLPISADFSRSERDG